MRHELAAARIHPLEPGLDAVPLAQAAYVLGGERRAVVPGAAPGAQERADAGVREPHLLGLPEDGGRQGRRRRGVRRRCGVRAQGRLGVDDLLDVGQEPGR